MVEKIKGAVETLQAIPRDAYAIAILMIGVHLVCKDRDAGMLVLGGALAVFRGDHHE